MLPEPTYAVFECIILSKSNISSVHSSIIICLLYVDDTWFVQGDQAECMYFVEHGKVRIVAKKKVQLN